MLFDLHCHSNLSDGVLSPEDLVSRAHEHGVTHLALTDHDCVLGIDRATVQAKALGMSLISGIEYSSQWSKRGVHIVGLGIDHNHPVIKASVEQQFILRQDRAEAIAVKLAKVGIPDALAGAKAYASADGLIARPHFAHFLVEQGHVSSVNQAFSRYLGQGKPADVKLAWPEMETVLGWIHAAGGLAVLAHPDKYKLTRTKQRALINAFVTLGGDAMEVLSGSAQPGAADYLAKLARERDLLASCGSDFHSPDQPWQELGRFGEMPANCEPIWEKLLTISAA